MKIKGIHFLDTSIILGVEVKAKTKKEKEEQRQCDRYVTRLNQIYKGVVSIPVFGEYLNKIVKKDYQTALKLFDFIYWFLEYKKIKVISVDYETMKVFQQIKEIDPRIELMDAMHIACAKSNGIKVFVTIDKPLIENQKLRENLKIEIKHPKDLIE